MINRTRSLLVGYGILVILALIALFPLTLVLINSFKDTPSIIRSPLALPGVFNFSNFRNAWVVGKFGKGLLHSITVVLVSVSVIILCSPLAGYVLAKKKVRMWSLVLVYFMVSMTVPIQLFLFPLYFGLSYLRLVGSLVTVGVILAALNMPLAVFLMRTYFLYVPQELEEAALIDGCGTITLISKVYVPIVSPGIVTVSIITGLFAWNEYLITSTFLAGSRKYTLTLAFLSMNGNFAMDVGVMMAGAVILVIPIVIFFLVMQRFVIDGLVGGAVKG